MAGKKKQTEIKEVEQTEIKFTTHYTNLSFYVNDVKYQFKDGKFNTNKQEVIDFLRKLEFVK